MQVRLANTGKAMTKTELTDWFETEFWPRYRTLTKTPFPTKWGAGKKGLALKSLITMDPSEALRDRILMAIAAQIKNRKQLYAQCGSMQAYEKKTNKDGMYLTRMGSTWLNQMGYEDEIPPIEGAADEVGESSVFCANKGCGFPVHGSSFKYCTQCEGRTNDAALKAQLVKMGLQKRIKETAHEYAMRCREKYQQLVGRVGK